MTKKRDLGMLCFLAVCQYLLVLETSAYKFDLAGLFGLSLIACYTLTGLAIHKPTPGLLKAWSFAFASLIGLIAGVMVLGIIYRCDFTYAMGTAAVLIGLTWPSLLCRYMFSPTASQHSPLDGLVGILLALGATQLILAALFLGPADDSTEQALCALLFAFFVFRLTDVVRPTIAGNVMWRVCLLTITITLLTNLKPWSSGSDHLEWLAVLWPPLVAGLSLKRRPLGGTLLPGNQYCIAVVAAPALEGHKS